MKRYVKTLLTVVICLFTFAGCSSKKAGGMQIFSASYADEYRNAAKQYYSNVDWVALDFFKSPEKIELEDQDVSFDLGSISDDTRYVVVISDDRSVLENEPVAGKRFSIYVYDNGKDNITIAVLYRVGTTENCVAQGKVTSGEIGFNRTINVESAGVTDPAERAGYIFNALQQVLADIEE